MTAATPAPRSPTPASAGIPRAGASLLALLLALGAGLLAAAPGRAQLSGFLATPTDQLAVPGLAADGEITPEGDLYTGWAEYELSYGRALRAWDQPTRSLQGPGSAEITGTLTAGAVSYRNSMFAVAVDGAPVVYETVTAQNLSRRAQTASLAMAVAYTRGPTVIGTHGAPTSAYRFERPVSFSGPGLYEQPGQAFSPAFRYTIAGRDLERSGLLLARAPAGGAAIAGMPSSSPTALHDTLAYRLPLRPGGSASLTWQIPLSPPAAGAAADAALRSLAPARAQASLAALWSAQEAGAMRIELPEARVAQAYRASLAEILMSRIDGPEGWLQATNRLQYRAFWIRDAALQTDSLDLAGLHSQAAQNLQYMDRFQLPDGLFISRAQQYDGIGQALWARDQHAALTTDPGYAQAQLARIAAAVGWIASASAADPLGLLPAADPGDDEFAYGHVTGDDLWAAAGLRSAVADARLGGSSVLAAGWALIEQRFERSLQAALAGAVARAGHIPPLLDSPAGRDWGNYYAAYPVQVLPAQSPAVGATVRWAQAHMIQGIAGYDGGASLHDYLGFAIFQTELERGQRAAAVAGLYSELAHTSSTDAGWEWGIAPWGARASTADLAPHGTFAADYIALLRNMLVREAAPGQIQLLAGASPAWLAPGEQISVALAPTDTGVISFTERSSAHGETLSWHAASDPGRTLQWALPPWARDVRSSGAAVRSHTLLLSGASGTASVSFGGSRPRQSYAGEVARLDAEYASRGLAEPLTSRARR